MKLVEPRIAEVVLFWEVLKLDQSTLVQRVKCSAHILAAAGSVAAQIHDHQLLPRAKPPLRFRK